MARRVGAGLLLGWCMVVATASGEDAGEATANARLIIPDGGPTTAAAEEPPRDDSPTPASRPSAVSSTTDERLIGRSATDTQRLGEAAPATDGGGWWQTLGALALVVVLIFLARHILARFAGGRAAGGASGVVEVLSRTPVGSRQSVMLLRVGGRVLVVGAGGETMNTLTEIDDPEQVSQLLGAVERARAGSLSGAFAGALHGQQAAWADDGTEDDLPTAGRPTTSSPVRGAVDQMKTVLGRLRGGRRGGPMS